MSYLPYIIFFSLLLRPASTKKPSCPTRCGNVLIPYPFGVGSNCSLEESFSITCVSSKPHLNVSNDTYVEVVEITLPTQIRVKYPWVVFGSCYNIESGDRTWSSDWNAVNLWKTQYSLSEDNWVTGIGCDDFVVMTSFVGNEISMDTCLGSCTGANATGSGHCPYTSDKNSAGEGCCRTPIPKGTSYLVADLFDLTKMRNRTRNFPCSFTFVNEKRIRDGNPEYSYNYSILLQNSTAFLERELAPLVRLDWRIGNQNCSRAKRNPNYACQPNSDCVDFGAKVGGYLCNCSEGYQGNPYLYPGCTDIDECAGNDNPCSPHSHCINTPGSYECPCPKGYFGNGKRDGSGCIHLPPSKSKKTILIGMGSGLGFLLLLLMCLWLYKVLQKRREKMLKEKFFKQNGGLLLLQQTNEGTIGQTKLFLIEELEVATDHFNENRILGQGGQGTVYKGMLSDGKIVAIKKSKLIDENQVEPFINEVKILSQINHRNVVRLLGCCLEIEVPLLVYEFMPNGTLYDLIHDPNKEFSFPWNMRLKVAADIAGALAYLHSASFMPIYHRDIKSSNILLDEKYVVKVSDFGTSRSISADQTHLTTLVKGTFGYLDPEYFQSSQFTEKSDVYSFGVVLAELLTSQRSISLDITEEERGLASRFCRCMEEGCVETILDSQVSDESKKEEVILVARLAQRCLNMKGRMRPTMKEVANELESYRMSQTCSGVKDDSEDAMRGFEDIFMSISDNEYTWTGSYKSATASSLDMHPLMFPKD